MPKGAPPRPMARGGRRMSVCVLVVYEHLDGRAQYDAYVEPNAPVLDIPDVAFHAPFHLPQLTRLAPEAVTWAHPVMPGFTKWRTMYLSMSGRYTSVW